MLALLQSFIDTLMRPELIWVLIPLAAISIGPIAILSEVVKDMLRKTEREKARQMYERLAMEKLDVVKTAIAMGYQQDELEDLDRRLELLIGQAEMSKLLNKKAPGTPLVAPGLVDDDLEEKLRAAGIRDRLKEG